MTQEQQEEYTRLIAEFDGWVYLPHIYQFCKGGYSYHNLDDFQYNRKYDWLMPVWVKFRDLSLCLTIEDESFFVKHFEDYIKNIESKILYTDSPKEAFTALGEAIKWYNTTKG